jgi:hypothetical protein
MRTGHLAFAMSAAVTVTACSRSAPAIDTAAATRRTGQSPAPAIPWAVTPDSFGRIPLGAPLATAAAALGDSIPAQSGKSESCRFATTPSMPPGTSLMLLRDSAASPIRVERVDVDSAGVRTRDGIGVGDTEQRALDVYRGRIRVERHKYTGPTGHNLVVTDTRDTIFQIVFETDGIHILRFHAGRLPAVGFVERCG